MNPWLICRDALLSVLVMFLGSLVINFFRAGSLLHDEQTAKLLSIEQRHCEELKCLYTGIFSLLEQTIRQVFASQEFNLAKEWADATAKIQLLAPNRIRDQYEEVSIRLSEWSRLYAQSTPRQIRVRDLDMTVTMIGSPDPTEKYREPAKAAYDSLQSELRTLMAYMRAELNDGRADSHVVAQGNSILRSTEIPFTRP